MYLKSCLTAILSIGYIVALSGCTFEHSKSHLVFATPSGLTQSRAIDLSELYVEISINGALVETIRSGNDQLWRATVSIPKNASSTISLAWYHKWECTNLLLATASESVTAGTEDIIIDFDNYDQDHDSDGDGEFNLSELNNGTPPANCSSTDSIFPEMVSIPTGCFDMGSPAGEVDRDATREMQHNVCITSFSMGQYEVTLLEFDRFTSANGLAAIRPDIEERDSFPVRDVSWKEAIAYANWLGTQDGNTYRLPTEEEWEYATRSGTTTVFNTGNIITTEQARFATTAGPTRVGTFAPNAFDLYDTHGNVAEMTCSEFYADYSGSSACITSTEGVEELVVRGGAHSDGTNPDDPGNTAQLRSAARRSSIHPDAVKNNTGFRLVKE